MLTINIGRKEAIFMGAIILVYVIAGIALAYNSGADPSVMGHSAEEVQGTISESGQLTISASTSFVELTFSKTYSVPPLVIATPLHGVVSGIGPNILAVTISNITTTNAWFDLDAINDGQDYSSSNEVSYVQYIVISR